MKLADLRACLLQTEDDYLVLGRTDGVEREGKLRVYVAWADLPDEYRTSVDGATPPQFVSVEMSSEEVVVE